MMIFAFMNANIPENSFEAQRRRETVERRVQLFKAEFLGVSLSWEPCFPESFLGAWSSSEFPKHSIPREKLFFPSVIVCTFSSLNALAFFGWALHFYVNVMHRSCVPWTVAALSEGHMQVAYVPLPLLLLDKTKTVRRFLILGQLGFLICLDSLPPEQPGDGKACGTA